VNNRPKNCKQKIKIFKRIFGQRRLPLGSLVWSVSVLPLFYRWHRARRLKEGQFYSSDIPVVAAVSAANPRMVQATSLPLQKKSAGRTKCPCLLCAQFWVAHASRVLVAASRRNKLLQGRQDPRCFRASRKFAIAGRARQRDIRFRQEIDDAILRDAVSARIELQATR
jgi:hypothetical protein